jgi:hypothetical protein
MEIDRNLFLFGTFRGESAHPVGKDELVSKVLQEEEAKVMRIGLLCG